MLSICNIAAYKFADLKDLKPLRERLIIRCKEWGLKGTILLSTEGINLFVAGSAPQIEQLLAELRSVPGLVNLAPKYSESDEQPFHRMLVKIKREIIAFGVEGIDPAKRPAPKLSPKQLKQWLDEGRPVTLLDTRNEYEIDLGTFDHAVRLGIGHFRQFPEAVKQLPSAWKQQPIVMFCTGGIRCEKAGPFMQREGFEQIFQLDGGILKYFEECGSAHYQGECFVFDQRVGVDPSLHESETAQCFVCQSPLSIEDQRDPRFVDGQSCPRCFQNAEDLAAASLQQRRQRIRELTTPLPGSQPYENQRPLNVPDQFDGQNVLDFLCGILGHIPRDEWQSVVDAGLLRRRTSHRLRASFQSEATCAVGRDEIVRSGQRYLHIQPSTTEPPVNVGIEILHEDEAIVVVQKPAPLPMHPCGRFNRNTLQFILGQVYEPQSLRPAHRLDANTTGVVVFTRTRHFAKLLQQQFEMTDSRRVEKRYLAKVHGHPSADRFSCELPISDQPGPLGSRDVVESGLPAVTHFEVLNRFPDGTSLLSVTPMTGRTNQIRVHLWSLGHAIYGDPTYLPNRQVGETQTTALETSPLCLHAQRITFTHPLTKVRVTFEAQAPKWNESS